MKTGLTITADNVGKVMAGIAILATNRVMVGVPAEDAERSQDDDERGPINNAALLYIHENGAPEAGIPARASLVPGIESVQGKIEEGLRAAADDAVEGRVDGVMRKLAAIGLIAQNAVRRKITTGPFTPLAPKTLAARRRRGRTGDKPLIDTAQMRAAVTYVLRKVSGR